MPPLENKFKVAIFDEFLDAFAKIPRAQQKKVNKFLRNFRENPTSSAINYESISDFTDQNLKTVRIDQAYRAIILRPEQGNVYVLLWVDNHDEAMNWARHKRVVIHPETGSLQVLTAQKSAAKLSEPPPGKAKALFEDIRDRELLRLGIPEELIPRTRTVYIAEQLEEIEELLPAEAYEALFFLSEGESLEEVERALAVDLSKNEEVDTRDFHAALDRDQSKRHFVVVDHDEALEAMLDAPLEKWRIFLHPSQLKLVRDNWNGPVRVLGGAGTGKTVVAMHRAAHLAEKVFTASGDKILFTTFTKNLAADVLGNLKKLCSPEALRRIEVKNIHHWVEELLKGYKYKMAFWGESDALKDLWKKALTMAPADYNDSFYRDEWEIIVQPQGCTSWEDYRKANRAGRGVRLSREQRKMIWPVFEEYRNGLEGRSLREPEDAFRDATSLISTGKISVHYSAAIVDEAQDLSTNAFTLLRKAIPENPNDLFIVGDGHQRIYRKKVVLKHAGINVAGKRGRRLRINYRTTEEIRRFAVALLEGCAVDDLDGGQDTIKGYKSLMHGEAPTLVAHADIESEIRTIVEWIKVGPAEQTCLVARTKDMRDKYERALKRNGFETYALKRTEAEDMTRPGVRVATMHRVKGLEFSRIVIAGVNEDLVPLKQLIESTDDKTVRSEYESMERALLYVATTRAKKAALLTSSGAPSKWV